MSDKKVTRTDIKFEGNVAVWDISTEGSISGTYSGTFKFRTFLNPLQRIAADREMRELIGANPTFASQEISYLAFCLSELKQRIVESPPFWNSTLQNSSMAGNIPDEEVLTIIMNAAVDAQLLYKQHLLEKKEDAIRRAKEALEKRLKDKKDEIEDNEDSD